MFDFSHFLTDSYAVALAAVMLAAMIYLCLYYGLYHFRVGRWGLKKEGQAPQGDPGLAINCPSRAQTTAIASNGTPGCWALAANIAVRSAHRPEGKAAFS